MGSDFVRDDGKRSGAVEEFYDSQDMLIQQNTFDWTYDEAGRLVEEMLTSAPLLTESLDDYTDTYGYDLSGNRLRYEHNAIGTVDDKLVTYAYDANDRLLTELAYAGLSEADSLFTTTDYEYGPSGGTTVDGDRQTKKLVYNGDDIPANLAGTTAYGYNARGRMSQIEIDSTGDGSINTTIAYEYDDAGVRVSQRSDDAGVVEDSTYLIDRQNLTGYAQVLEETVVDGLDQLIRNIAYALGHDVLSLVRTDYAAGAPLLLLYDGQGSTRGLVDAMGEPLVGQVYAYNAYGERLDGATAPTSLLFQGEQADRFTGQAYHRARYYNFATGRWNRSDDYAGAYFDPQSLHKYTFTHGDPRNGIDPSGLININSTLGAIGVAAAVGGITSGSVSGLTTSGGLAVRSYAFLDGFVHGFVSTAVSASLTVYTGGTLLPLAGAAGNLAGSVASLYLRIAFGEEFTEEDIWRRVIVDSIVGGLTLGVASRFTRGPTDLVDIITQRANTLRYVGARSIAPAGGLATVGDKLTAALNGLGVLRSQNQIYREAYGEFAALFTADVAAGQSASYIVLTALDIVAAADRFMESIREAFEPAILSDT